MAKKSQTIEVFVSTRQSVADMIHEANNILEKILRQRRILGWVVGFERMEDWGDTLALTYIATRKKSGGVVI